MTRILLITLAVFSSTTAFANISTTNDKIITPKSQQLALARCSDLEPPIKIRCLP
ncbi:MAG: hypothetical protein K1X44_08310 [Alphaproteobacteria bacterium]|nr:hypothetical protein [Alphaproteobacteria bacterium]